MRRKHYQNIALKKTIDTCNKRLITDPKGISEFFSLERTLMFSEGPVIKCFVVPTNSNIGRTTKQVFARLKTGGKTNLLRFQDHLWVENWSRCFSREWVSFDKWQVTRTFSNRKTYLIWLEEQRTIFSSSNMSMYTWTLTWKTLLFLAAIRIISEHRTAESAGWLFIKATCFHIRQKE